MIRFLSPSAAACLKQQRELLDRRGDHDRVGVRRLDLGELRAHVLGRLVHGLDQADLHVMRLAHLAEILRGAAAPVVVDDEEVGLLDRELSADLGVKAAASTADGGEMRKM